MTGKKNTRLLIGIDPGKVTGLAVLDGDEFWSANLDPLQACSELDRMLVWGRPTIVACERYTFTKAASRMTRQYDALEVIGTARYLCHKHSVTFIIRGAAESSRAGSPDVLRAFGWWVKAGDDCNRAAAQVALILQQSYPAEYVERAHLTI